MDFFHSHQEKGR